VEPRLKEGTCTPLGCVAFTATVQSDLVAIRRKAKNRFTCPTPDRQEQTRRNRQSWRKRGVCAALFPLSPAALAQIHSADSGNSLTMGGT
jgi:hypothetical protein